MEAPRPIAWRFYVVAVTLTAAAFAVVIAGIDYVGSRQPDPSLALRAFLVFAAGLSVFLYLGRRMRGLEEERPMVVSVVTMAATAVFIGASSVVLGFGEETPTRFVVRLLVFLVLGVAIGLLIKRSNRRRPS